MADQRPEDPRTATQRRGCSWGRRSLGLEGSATEVHHWMLQSSVLLPGLPMAPMLVPFISQMDTRPEVCRHRMSAMSSSLKSPTPWMAQSSVLLPGLPMALLTAYLDLSRANSERELWELFANSLLVASRSPPAWATEFARSFRWEFDLVGIIDADDPAVRGNTDMVLINVAYFDEARLAGKGTTGWYIERIADSGQAKAISAQIDTLFMNSPDETKTQPEKEFAIGFAKQIGDIGALVTRILAAVFFTILLLTGNTMAQSIRERIPELAILKTLGFSDGKVTLLVLAEAGLLLLLGGGAGMAIAVGLMPVLNGSTGGRFPPLFVSSTTWMAALAVATALALAIGLPPALRARRLQIVDALSGHR